jgi:hypothetical protein
MREEDLYRQDHGYWQQVADNLSKWLGLPHLTALDVAIALPLFPWLLIAIIVWAPWEPWVWKNVPKTITGPYLLYSAFAFWHFHARWWWVLPTAALGVAICGVAVNEVYSRRAGGRDLDADPVK